MAFQKVEIHPLNLEVGKKSLQRVIPSKQEYKAVLEHLRQLSTGEVTGKPISERRQLKLLHSFALFFRLFKKPTNKLIREDLSKFKEELINKKFLKQNGEPYSDTSLEDMTEAIVRYLEWRYPKKMNSFISTGNKPLRKWFVVRSKPKTPEVLNEQEIKTLYKESRSLWQKYAIAVLFGGGLRVEEFLNLRFEDFQEPTKNFPYWQVDVREEYSKTLGRKIGLYWDHCTESITKYFASVEKKDNKDRVLKINYDTMRMFLSRLGKKVLNKRVNPHMFRKSSATFYASKLNRQQLCKKFGWQFKSDVVDVYINRAGVDEFEVKDVILNDDISVLKKAQQEQKIKHEKELAEVYNKMFAMEEELQMMQGKNPSRLVTRR